MSGDSRFPIQSTYINTNIKLLLSIFKYVKQKFTSVNNSLLPCCSKCSSYSGSIE